MEIETLHALLAHDPVSGTLLWKHRPIELFVNLHAYSVWNTRYSNKRALYCLNRDGRAHGKLLGKYVYRSRVIWAMEFGSWPSGVIDHIDGNRSNDSIVNLRDCDTKTNSRNLKTPTHNKSGHIGVFWNTQKAKWAVTIKVNRRNIHLGFFDDFSLACAARKMSEKHYGFHQNHGR